MGRGRGFIEFAGGHTFGGGGDFFFAEDRVGVGVGDSFGLDGGGSSLLRGGGGVAVSGGEDLSGGFRDGKIFESVGGGGVEQRFVGGFGGGDAFIGAESFASEGFEFLEAGEFIEIAEAEAHQEFLGGFVEDGAAHDFLAPGGGDEFFVEEGGDDAGGVDAADFGNFGSGDGLLVGDDGESFEGGHGEAKRRAKGLDETADDVVVLGLVYIL